VLDFNEQFALGTRLPRDEVLGRLFWETAWWRGQPEIVAAWPLRLQAALGPDAPGVYHLARRRSALGRSGGARTARRAGPA
jgi:hypothetical protein